VLYQDDVQDMRRVTAITHGDETPWKIQ